MHIVEGEVRVIEASGRERVLKAGDKPSSTPVRSRPGLSKAIVRKIAMCRHPMPTSLGFAIRALRKVATLMREGQAEAVASASAASDLAPQSEVR